MKTLTGFVGKSNPESNIVEPFRIVNWTNHYVPTDQSDSLTSQKFLAHR